MTPFIERTRNWLKNDALPLWSSRGIDWEAGGFVENLSNEGERLDGTKRTMVQARQIYSFRVALDLGFLSRDLATKAIEHSADFLVKHAYLPSGGIAHGLDRNGSVITPMADLYAQAFALFGMANAYRVSKKAEYKSAAARLLQYLHRERRVPAGGYTEVKDGGVQYQSNPHMHLFEAALAWMEADAADPSWRKLADEVHSLAHAKFVDPATGLLAEHFDANWNPIRDPRGRFVFEPGHQFEWAWLLSWYERITKTKTSGLAAQFFRTSEQHGIDPEYRRAYDEVWSDFEPKKKSSRFWPQTERIKAAMSQSDGAAGDEAMATLFKYLEVPVRGLWNDTWLEDGTFARQPVKASSLYHIIGAMNEYLLIRPKLEK